MTHAPDELSRFIDQMEARFGFRLEDRRAATATTLANRAAHRGESIREYLEWVERGDAGELRALAEQLSVGETYFFRHVEQFNAYADLLDACIAARGHARVLSAGCSSGEEPYTLAMLAHQRVSEPRDVTIHAVDFNPAALQRCARARYSPWALRATPPEVEQRWFQRDGRDFVLSPQIRGAVQFGEANLMDGNQPWAQGPWDVIFCRNVIMYFSEPRAQSVLDRFARALVPGGYLFLGHAETLRGRSTDFELCHTHGTFYYQRISGQPSRSSNVARGIPEISRIDVPETQWVSEIQAASERVREIVDRALGDLPPTKERPAGAVLDELRLLLAQERFVEILERFDELPEHAIDRDIVLLRAVVLAQAGRLAEAEAASRTILERERDNASAHYLLSVCRDTAGDLVGACEHAQLAADLDPSFAMARMQLGLVARRAGDRRTAALALAEAIRLFEHEEPERLALFSGGFGSAALVGMCRAELAAVEATR